MSEINIEIEKKYIIELPDVSEMEKTEGYTKSEITQIYLSSETGITHRVRSRVTAGNITYTETKKLRIDDMSAFEDEREISREAFSALSRNKKSGTQEIKKVRHTFIYKGQMFEVDVYPEWKRSAILETELKTRETAVEFPSFIKIIKDVTGDGRYSNAGMARAFPDEM